MSATVLLTSDEQIKESYMRYYLMRINMGLTDNDVAKNLKMSLNALINWRTGKAMPSLKNLTKLARYFDVQVSFITNGVYVGKDGIAN